MDYGLANTIFQPARRPPPKTGGRRIDGVSHLQNGGLLCNLYRMEIQRITDSPFLWGAAGLIIGVALGVTTISAWIVAIGLGGHLLYLKFRGPAPERGVAVRLRARVHDGLDAGLRRTRTD